MKNETIELFVSGRLCLFGEHSDWAGTNRTVNSEIVPGCAIVTGTQQGIYARAKKSDVFSVTSTLEELKEGSFECPMDLESLSATAHQGGYFSYVAGVASYMCEWYNVGGVSIEITKRDLPVKKGLSSSAAICVLVAQAFNQLYNLNLNTRGIMNIAYWGEQRTPSRCGRVDQACAFGPHPVSLVFDGNELRVDQIPVKKPLYYVFADLMAEKDTIKILADLNSGYPFARNEKEKTLHEALGEDNRRITARARELMKQGDARELGHLMTEAQEIFDTKVAPMCPDELSAPVLHSVLNNKTIKDLTYGGKGVGSQGDGTVQFLAKDQKSQDDLIDFLSHSLGLSAFPLTLRPQKGIKKAIIPVAGFGTRLYPETRFTKKELCPIVDRDGLVKPILLVLLEQLDMIGIEEICLIISPDEEEMYTQLLMQPLSRKHYEKLPEKMKAYEDRMARITKKIKFAKQFDPKGFGHAVYQAASFAGKEPVLLLLGDTIYKSNSSTPCLKQIVDAYDTYGKSIVALQTVPVEDVSSFGVFSGTWDDPDERILDCQMVVEKPTPDFAREYLTVPRKKMQDQCCAAFGAYVLTEKIFSYLGDAVRNDRTNAKGEIDFTDAFKRAIEKKELIGFLVDGESYDLGNAAAYQAAFTSFNT